MLVSAEKKNERKKILLVASCYGNREISGLMATMLVYRLDPT